MNRYEQRKASKIEYLTQLLEDVSANPLNGTDAIQAVQDHLNFWKQATNV